MAKQSAQCIHVSGADPLFISDIPQCLIKFLTMYDWNPSLKFLHTFFVHLIVILKTLIGVRAEARRSYGMRSDFVKGRQQLLEPFSRS
jgi:hypothetical protein